ncbi:hypothetical protein P153DRAFT_365886 [Dothidotthia symphoricarpi CBS 119687]|uniref:Uncharacterized protein n=1 Tax=Dothidotthia symphoricarpi CBS 119687 TaxID=1392245 RepID=A0A6A6AE97_9PLEO|nr:uncharacterized protein P153DRAFT_365886 [Dothidotthia symphoricarpi CBS 119687]KAF2130252.1 hypothetical protein P153DRAFT_365886 [Dothidotthia symphoricarpi CBS 119687]
MAEEAQKNVVQLAEQLAEGFAALSGEYQVLFDQQRQLESKLSWAKQQYLDLLKRFTPSTLAQDHIVFLQDLERVADVQPRAQSNLVEQLAQNDDVERKSRAVVIRQAEVAAAGLRASLPDPGVKIWSGPSADRPTSPLRIQTNNVTPPIEKDFTIAGTPSKLGCPFASGSGRGSPLATPRSSTSRLSVAGRRSKRPSFCDPIRAEICGNIPASPSASVDGSAAVCPIRFLDQHDPEEVAKYFEKHKHELPRSHEVCINRFQSNQESIEQLDRKYGNLVNMIQGLGQKHQAWLPEEPEDDIEEEPESGANPDAKADAKVESWAKAVSASLQDGVPPSDDEPEEPNMEETRTAHFDRPLKEVRLGESPSRPWGISVPAKYTDAGSSSSVGSVPTASPPVPSETDHPVVETPPKTGKCPFDHRAMGLMPPKQESIPTTHPFPQPASTTPEPPATPPPQPRAAPPKDVPPQAAPPRSNEHDGPQVVPQMIFNGPVFLGYSPDQLIALLQNSNIGSMMR